MLINTEKTVAIFTVSKNKPNDSHITYTHNQVKHLPIITWGQWLWLWQWQCQDVAMRPWNKL